MQVKNQILSRPHLKPIVWDAYFSSNSRPKSLVIFCHGYKGFKDWGAWHLVAKRFMEANFFFVKFNFSHNGGTVDQPIDFQDLEAFAENNYTKELIDLDDMITYLLSKNNSYYNDINPESLFIIGHSRGGGISMIKASEDSRINKIITWASVSSFGKRTSTTGNLEQWKKNGVKYVLNSRTNQQMPHNYQFYEDFKANEERLNIEVAVRKITIPQLIIHGENDPSVSFQEAEIIHSNNSDSTLVAIKNSNHVFNAKHPWLKSYLPIALEEVVNHSISFLKKK